MDLKPNRQKRTRQETNVCEDENLAKNKQNQEVHIMRELITVNSRCDYQRPAEKLELEAKAKPPQSGFLNWESKILHLKMFKPFKAKRIIPPGPPDFVSFFCI